MPLRPLPPELVARLMRVGRKIGRETFKEGGNPINPRLSRMKSIDHRKKDPRRANIFPEDTRWWGGRVREMNVSRNFPGVRLAIKRTQHATARETIAEIRKRVDSHNAEYKPKEYVLLMPHAYDISQDLIAMSKTNAPSLEEVVRQANVRGRTVFGMLQAQGFTLEKLRSVSKRVVARTGWRDTNVLIVGISKGKLLLLPLLDLEYA